MKIKIFINSIGREMFIWLTISLVVFTALELLWPGVVSSFINLNFVLIFWLITGIVLLFIGNNKIKI